MQEKIKQIVESSAFQWFILACIVMVGILVGLETYPDVMSRHGDLIHQLNDIILWVFVVEAVLKMAQHGRHFYRYFYDPWNVFDFTIVAVCFLPWNSQYAAVLRLARIMRALRLMTVLPQLQLIVGALIKSIPSMGYVGVLLSLNFYVYAVMGVFLFRGNDPVHFRSLETAMLTLFRVVTLEDWTDVMYIQMYGSDVYPYTNTSGIEPIPHAMPIVGAAFFVSFVMLGTMIMLNLFIGVILNSMDEAKHEREMEHIAEQTESGEIASLDDDVAVMKRQIDDLRESLDNFAMRVQVNQSTAEQ